MKQAAYDFLVAATGHAIIIIFLYVYWSFSYYLFTVGSQDNLFHDIAAINSTIFTGIFAFFMTKRTME